jgi:DNA-binding HxlR family transcriptional regulator
MVKEERGAALCPSVEAAFALLSRKWAGLIVHSLSEGELLYSELGRALPSLSARVLCVRLRDLEGQGIVERRVEAGPPLRVSYGLSPKGLALVPIMESIAAWAKRWNKDQAGTKARRNT